MSNGELGIGPNHELHESHEQPPPNHPAFVPFAQFVERLSPSDGA
jgi:hypothetical protein